jgi:hypothetical protein
MNQQIYIFDDWESEILKHIWEDWFIGFSRNKLLKT